MTTKSTNAESMSLTPTALLNLFVLDLSPIGIATQYYFVDGTSSNYQSIVFGGETYIPFPVQLTEQGYDGQGGIIRPKLSVSNVNGFVSNLLLQDQDLVGANVIWTRVYARFVDAVNYPGGISPYTPDPTAAYAPEIYYINRKTKENQTEVEWELATSFELDGRKLPSRTCLANICQWRYRESSTCGYAGAPIADVNNNLFSGPPYNFGSLNSRGTWSASATYAQQDWVTIYTQNQALLNIPLVFVCLANGVVGQSNSPLVSANINWVQDGCAKNLAGCRIRFPFNPVAPPPFTRNCDVESGNNNVGMIIQDPSQLVGLNTGMTVSGVGLQPSTYIQTITNGPSYFFSVQPTPTGGASGAGELVYFFSGTSGLAVNPPLPFGAYPGLTRSPWIAGQTQPY